MAGHMDRQEITSYKSEMSGMHTAGIIGPRGLIRRERNKTPAKGGYHEQ